MELYDANSMPPSSDPKIREAQEKFARGESFFTTYGRDQGKITKQLGNYQCKPNCCYRAISPETYKLYEKNGVIGDDRKDEYIEWEKDGETFNNNAGIDWYLGGAAPGRKYGIIVIECPAYKEYFQPAADNGTHMTIDSTVRHMKSSPKANPIPFSMITNVFDYSKIIGLENERFAASGEQQLPSSREPQEPEQYIDTMSGGKSK